MLKLVGVVIGAASVLLFASQAGIAGLHSPDGENVGAKLAAVTELASEQVGDVTDSLGDVSAAKSRTFDPRDADRVIPAGSAVPQSISNSELYEQTPVGEALARLAALDLPGSEDQAAYIAAVNDLQSEWRPRYETAKGDHARLLHRIALVEDTAASYFQRQGELTARIHDPDLRAGAAAGDAKELRKFEDWRGASTELVARVDAIVRDLDDMDIVIEKLNLSANFSALHTSFESLTLSITGLQRDLKGFRTKSDEIARTFGN